MNLAEVGTELDKITSRPITQDVANRIRQIEELWSDRNNQRLGDFRQVIEDRLDLARSQRTRAGF